MYQILFEMGEYLGGDTLYALITRLKAKEYVRS
jgi:hypothetical protein